MAPNPTQRYAKKSKKKSRFKHLENYGLISLIVKSGDDLRQEQFASQMGELTFIGN